MLRTHTTAYLISRAKTAQDARQFFVWRFGGSANDRSVQLEPQMCLTNSTGRSPIFCLALQRFCQRPQCAMRAPNVLENSTGPWPICFLALRRLSATACARLGPEMLGKQHRILVNLFLALQRLCQRPQCAFRLRSAWKTAQDARQFVFLRFLAPFGFKMHPWTHFGAQGCILKRKMSGMSVCVCVCWVGVLLQIVVVCK